MTLGFIVAEGHLVHPCNNLIKLVILNGIHRQVFTAMYSLRWSSRVFFPFGVIGRFGHAPSLTASRF
jgi:hypothetical protein